MTFIELAQAITEAENRAAYLDTALIDAKNKVEELKQEQAAALSAMSAVVSDANAQYQTAVTATKRLYAEMHAHMSKAGFSAEMVSKLDSTPSELKEVYLRGQRQKNNK